MVEGPHPVGLSDITGGSNLAAILVSFFTLKPEIFLPQLNTHNIHENILISRCCARVTCCLVSQTRWRPPTGRDLQHRVWWMDGWMDLLVGTGGMRFGAMAKFKPKQPRRPFPSI